MPDPSMGRSGATDQRTQTWDLFIPERGSRHPFRAILDRPERIRVAWHRDARGIHELLDGDGKHAGITLSEPLWEIREYRRTIVYELSAYYELIGAADDA